MRKWIFMISLASSTYANDIASELNDFLEQAGYASNVTHPHAYQSQASGYFGGGSLYTRPPVKRWITSSASGSRKRQ